MRWIHFILQVFLLAGCHGKSFREPTMAMEETIHEGQVFWVKKTSQFSRNDIAVFDYYGPDYSQPAPDVDSLPYHWEKRVYRIIAVSGDSIAIENGKVLLNGQEISLPSTALQNYYVVAKGALTDLDGDPERAPVMLSQSPDSTVWLAGMTEKKAVEIENRKPFVISVRPYIDTKQEDYQKIAVANGNGKSGIDEYGPFHIPGPGETVVISDTNRLFYHQLSDVKDGPYQVREKLYFFLGDNRHGAMDSRYIGLVPQSKMWGIVK